MRTPAIFFGLVLVIGTGCDPTVPCTPEAAARGECVLSTDTGSGGSTGPTGPTDSGSGVGFESYGTKPSGGHISLDCTPSQIPALAAHDCLYSHFQNPETVKCTLKMADRLGVVIGVATPVSFMSEAGAISPVASSPSFPATPETLGHADGYLEVFGSPLPRDVDPLSGEVSATADFGCGPRTVNPRDGYVTVIAWVRGEEGFVDVNQNGRYDGGEPFVDQGEPFVDANDNGRWDPGEWWLDVNGDGQYTGPNGGWDADTVIWSQTRVVYTGNPAFGIDAAGGNVFTRVFDPGIARPPMPTPQPAPFAVRAGPPPTSAVYGLFFTDYFLNPLDPSAGYSVASALGNVTASITGPAVPLREPPNLFRLLYCDGPQFPATCHDGPVESGCRTAPCFVVPEVGRCLTDQCRGFQYGRYADLIIEGKRAGPDTVWVSVELEGSTTSFPFAGTCTP
jgi:hypothetical protein